MGNSLTSYILTMYTHLLPIVVILGHVQVKEVPAATVHSQDFPFSAFKVAISRIQKAALSKVNCPVPSPEEQLALISKKKGKGERLKLWWQITACSCFILALKFEPV